MAATPMRQIRIPDDLWNRATARAAREGTNVSEKIRTLLESYVNDDVSAPDALERIAVQITEVRQRLVIDHDAIRQSAREAPPL